MPFIYTLDFMHVQSILLLQLICCEKHTLTHLLFVRPWTFCTCVCRNDYYNTGRLTTKILLENKEKRLLLSVNANVFYMSSLTQSEVERSHACTFALTWYTRLYFLLFIFNNIPQSSQCFLLWAEILTEALTVVTTHEIKVELDICDLLNNSLPEPNISRKQLFSCSLCRWNATCMTCLMSLKKDNLSGKGKSLNKLWVVRCCIFNYWFYTSCHQPNQKVFFLKLRRGDTGLTRVWTLCPRRNTALLFQQVQ